MRLQYQLSNGAWIDCEDRTEEFLIRCEKNNGPDEAGTLVVRFQAVRDATRNEICSALASGMELRNDRDDWYSNCRDGDASDRKTAEILKRQIATIDTREIICCKSCGQAGHAGAYPFSTLPGSGLCDDCI